MTTDPTTFVITTAREGEPALIDELAMHDLVATPTGKGAVHLRGSLTDALRVCLWSRVASRVLMPLGIASAEHADALYETVREGPWDDHLDPGKTFAIDVVGTNHELRHPHFTALRVKDAIVDHFRERTGERPSVDKGLPDVRLNVRVDEGDAVVSIDLTGSPLHFRGQGRDGGPAPLRETLAAALLMFADWPRLCHEGVPLVDAFCGSGTLLREAAGFALDRAPGLDRRHWGFHGWPGHDPVAWEDLVDEARSRSRSELPSPILGYDLARDQVRRARANLAAYDLAHLIPVVRLPFDRVEPPEGRDEVPRGLLVSNPPYGERLGNFDEVAVLWRSIGDQLRRDWLGWTAWLLSGSKAVGQELGLKPSRRIPIRNGPLDGRLLQVPISTEPVARLADDADE